MEKGVVARFVHIALTAELPPGWLSGVYAREHLRTAYDMLAGISACRDSPAWRSQGAFVTGGSS
jgi:hypothetical protein